VMQEAVAAEEQGAAEIVSTPQRKTRRIERSPALEDVLREALAAEDAAAAPAPSPRTSSLAVTSPKHSIAPLAASTFQETLNAALREHEQLQSALGSGTAPRSRSRARWIRAVLLVAMIAGGAAFYVAETFESDARVAAPPTNAASDGASASDAPTYGNAVMALRQLQVASIPTTSLPAYAARVSAARAVVARYMESDAPSDAKRSLGAILDLHLLAFTAWQARSIDAPAAWEPISRSATLELCEAVNNAAYIAERPGQSTAQARGRAIAGSIPLLWDCARRRLAQLDAAS